MELAVIYDLAQIKQLDCNLVPDVLQLSFQLIIILIMRALGSIQGLFVEILMQQVRDQVLNVRLLGQVWFLLIEFISHALNERIDWLCIVVDESLNYSLSSANNSLGPSKTLSQFVNSPCIISSGMKVELSRIWVDSLIITVLCSRIVPHWRLLTMLADDAVFGESLFIGHSTETVAIYIRADRAYLGTWVLTDTGRVIVYVLLWIRFCNTWAENLTFVILPQIYNLLRTVVLELNGGFEAIDWGASVYHRFVVGRAAALRPSILHVVVQHWTCWVARKLCCSLGYDIELLSIDLIIQILALFNELLK